MERARGVVPGAWGRGNRRVDRASQFFQILNIEYGGLVSGREYTLAYYTTCTDTYVPTPAARVFFFLCVISTLTHTYPPPPYLPSTPPSRPYIHASPRQESNPIQSVPSNATATATAPSNTYINKQTNSHPTQPTRFEKLTSADAVGLGRRCAHVDQGPMDPRND